MTSIPGPEVPKTTDYEIGKAGKKWTHNQTLSKELDYLKHCYQHLHPNLHFTKPLHHFLYAHEMSMGLYLCVHYWVALATLHSVRTKLVGF